MIALSKNVTPSLLADSEVQEKFSCFMFSIPVFLKDPIDNTEVFLLLSFKPEIDLKVSNGAKIRNRYNQVPHLTQDTNGKVTNSQKTSQTRAKRSALSQQVTTKHI